MTKKILAYGLSFSLFASALMSGANAAEPSDGDIVTTPPGWATTTSTSAETTSYTDESTSESEVTTSQEESTSESEVTTFQEESTFATESTSTAVETTTSVEYTTPEETTTTNNQIVSKDIKNGTVFTVKKYKAKFKVINAKKKTVAFLSSTKKNRVKATVPSTVTYKGTKFKVVTISSKAFVNNKKLTSVVIGSNVVTIKSEAFKNCKNLKKIVVKSKNIKVVGKKVFKALPKLSSIKVPAKKIKAYKKLFRRRGLSSTVTIKK